MSMQHAWRRPSSEAFHLPQAHYALGAGTGELGTIGPPVQVVEAGIPARASQEAFVGRKSQSPHPAAMPYEALDAGRWAVRPDLPQPDRTRIVAGGEQLPIRTPGQRGDWAGMGHLLEEGAQLRI